MPALKKTFTNDKKLVGVTWAVYPKLVTHKGEFVFKSMFRIEWWGLT